VDELLDLADQGIDSFIAEHVIADVIGEMDQIVIPASRRLGFVAPNRGLKRLIWVGDLVHIGMPELARDVRERAEYLESMSGNSALVIP
jgi:hypothetical protein